MTFRLGKQKLVKNNQDNRIQSITLCNTYFSNKVYAVYNGVWGKDPEDGEYSSIFVLKVTLQSERLPLTVSYRKNWAAGCTSCSPNNFVRGGTAALVQLLPGPHTYIHEKKVKVISI